MVLNTATEVLDSPSSAFGHSGVAQGVMAHRSFPIDMRHRWRDDPVIPRIRGRINVRLLWIG